MLLPYSAENADREKHWAKESGASEYIEFFASALGSGYMVFGYMVFLGIWPIFWVVPISPNILKIDHISGIWPELRLYGQFLGGPNVDHMSGTECTCLRPAMSNIAFPLADWLKLSLRCVNCWFVLSTSVQASAARELDRFPRNVSRVAKHGACLLPPLKEVSNSWHVTHRVGSRRIWSNPCFCH